MDEIIIEEEDINSELPEIIGNKEENDIATPLVEVAMLKVKDNTEEFTISGDKITFISRLELVKIENPIETTEYPNSERRGNNLIIKRVASFTKIQE